jgi:hypothetical protein
MNILFSQTTTTTTTTTAPASVCALSPQMVKKNEAGNHLPPLPLPGGHLFRRKKNKKNLFYCWLAGVDPKAQNNNMPHTQKQTTQVDF